MKAKVTENMYFLFGKHTEGSVVSVNKDRWAGTALGSFEMLDLKFFVVMAIAPFLELDPVKHTQKKVLAMSGSEILALISPAKLANPAKLAFALLQALEMASAAAADKLCLHAGKPLNKLAHSKATQAIFGKKLESIRYNMKDSKIAAIIIKMVICTAFRLPSIVLHPLAQLDKAPFFKEEPTSTESTKSTESRKSSEQTNTDTESYNDLITRLQSELDALTDSDSQSSDSEIQNSAKFREDWFTERLYEEFEKSFSSTEVSL